MDIREAKREDLFAAAKIQYQNWESVYQDILPKSILDQLQPSAMEEELEIYLEDEDSGVFIAQEGNRIQGFASFHKDEKIQNCLYLSSLHVSEEDRGKGIGTQLIRKVLEHGREKGFQKMSICIFVENSKAGNLYRKMGARHYEYFEDQFFGIRTNSEKLIWDSLQ